MINEIEFVTRLAKCLTTFHAEIQFGSAKAFATEKEGEIVAHFSAQIIAKNMEEEGNQLKPKAPEAAFIQHPHVAA